jgi:Nucleotidyltransferase of unknown function (DUF6036)
LRAVANITDHTTFVIVGSAAVIARLRGQLPGAMMLTPEVDIFAAGVENPEALSDLIDGSIGQDSIFHRTFGYYADGVSPETSKMPSDWRQRAIECRSPEAPRVTAVIPEENDIALAKLAAWRDKDIEWLKEGVIRGMLSLEKMEERIPLMPVLREQLQERVEILRRSKPR